MKKFILIFLISFSLSAQFIPRNGLRLSINFNEAVFDSINPSMKYKISNLDSIHYVESPFGKTNEAILIGNSTNTNFTGIELNIDSVLPLDNNTTDYSLSFWSKQRIFFNGSNNYVNQQIIQINSKSYLSSIPSHSWINFGVGSLEYSSYQGDTKKRINGNLPDKFNSSDWHLFSYIFSRKDSIVSVYIDSNLIVSQKFLPFLDINDSSVKMFIGYGYQDAPGFEEFSNYYDDIVIYDRMLNKQELESIINSKSVIANFSEVNFEKENFVIYPNPTSKYINLKEIRDFTKYEILNIYGSKVKFGNLNNTQISIEELNSGTYFIYFFDGNAKFNQFKFVKY